MSRWHNDKSKVKDVFDSIRNFGICGFILYLGVSSLVSASSGNIAFVRVVVGFLLIFLAFFLYVVNAKIINRLFREWSPDGVFSSLPDLLFGAMITLLSVVVLTGSVLGIKFADGKSIGDVKVSDILPTAKGAAPSSPSSATLEGKLR